MVAAARLGPERKVRAPQGRMLANGEERRLYGKCHRKENANPRFGEDAKLKRWCKRPPALAVMQRLGKPHPEQG